MLTRAPTSRSSQMGDGGHDDSRDRDGDCL